MKKKKSKKKETDEAKKTKTDNKKLSDIDGQREPANIQSYFYQLGQM
ncbi:MAG: hypothetical protein U9P63_02390 [Patescibacteria group bacterium]|nr:hypothetical protein [Patescibacteria group bacterium]